MSQPMVVFDHVWKKFRKGERHDSLRDFIPALVKGIFRRRSASDLEKEEFWALKDVSFEVTKGEALGIIGPNGAGKSTVLKLLSKILKPNLGHCRVVGRIGALIEVSGGFHPDLTGRENIDLQGAIMGMKRKEIMQKLDDIVEFAGIGDFLGTQVKRYSSGMLARLGFAIAAHLDPDVLLIDEILAVGDMTFQQRCYQRLEDLRQRGTTIVFVSHNLKAVSTLCDRTVLLTRGKEPLIGETAQVVDTYVSFPTEVSDKRVELLGTSLVPPEGGSLPDFVPSGEELLFRFSIRICADLPRSQVTFIVHRFDGLMMFLGSSDTSSDVPFQDLKEGMVLTGEVRFRTNLLWGTYHLSLELRDADHHRKAVLLHNISVFSVERTYHKGYTQLDPHFSLSTEAEASALGLDQTETRR